MGQTKNALEEVLYIPKDEVCIVLAVSRNGLACLRKRDPTFPEPIKNGQSQQGGVCFLYEEVLAWYKNKLLNR